MNANPSIRLVTLDGIPPMVDKTEIMLPDGSTRVTFGFRPQYLEQMQIAAESMAEGKARSLTKEQVDQMPVPPTYCSFAEFAYRLRSEWHILARPY